MANIDDAFTIDKLSLDDNLLITSGISDPTIGIGYEAPIGSLYARTNGILYQKIDTADVDWIKLSTNLDNILNNTLEPTGITNRTDSNVSFTDATRTFTIAPVITEFTYFIKGTEYTISASKQIILPDITGLYYIYFDSNKTLNTINSFTYDLLSIYSYCSAIYWNSETQKGIYVADERHGITMDAATHLHLHTSLGTQYVSGLNTSNIISDGNGSLDSHVQFDLSNGVIRDEDLQHDIIDNLPQSLTSIAQIPILYKFGINNYWRIKPSDNFPIIQDGSAGFIGTGLPAFNELIGNDWQLTEVTNNNFFFVHYLATNDINNPIVGILGINQYQNKPQGQAAASIEFNSLDGLPFQEYVPISTVIFEAKSSFTNTIKSRIVSTSDGFDYIDWSSAINTFNIIGTGGSSTNDELIKISNNDTTAGYLTNKLITGSSLTLIENNDGLNETLTIDTSIPLSDIQTEIDNIEIASGGIFASDGTYDGLIVDALLTNVSTSTNLLNVLDQLDTAISAAPSILNGLNDVTLITPTDGQTLVYDITTSQWINVTTTATEPGSGRLLQLKFNKIPAISGTILVPLNATDPLITDGVQLWSEVITPALLTSNVRVSTTCTVSGSSNSTQMIFIFFRDNICIGSGLVNMSARTAGHPFAITIYDSPNTTSNITYSCRVGKTSGNTWYINRLNDATLLNSQLANQAYTIEEIGVI